MASLAFFGANIVQIFFPVIKWSILDPYCSVHLFLICLVYIMLSARSVCHLYITGNSQYSHLSSYNYLASTISFLLGIWGLSSSTAHLLFLRLFPKDFYIRFNRAVLIVYLYELYHLFLPTDHLQLHLAVFALSAAIRRLQQSNPLLSGIMLSVFERFLFFVTNHRLSFNTLQVK